MSRTEHSRQGRGRIAAAASSSGSSSRRKARRPNGNISVINTCGRRCGEQALQARLALLPRWRRRPAGRRRRPAARSSGRWCGSRAAGPPRPRPASATAAGIGMPPAARVTSRPSLRHRPGKGRGALEVAAAEQLLDPEQDPHGPGLRATAASSGPRPDGARARRCCAARPCPRPRDGSCPARRSGSRGRRPRRRGPRTRAAWP